MGFTIEQAQLRLDVDSASAVKKLAILELQEKELISKNKELTAELNKLERSIRKSDEEWSKMNRTLNATAKTQGKTSEAFINGKKDLDALRAYVLANNKAYTDLSAKLDTNTKEVNDNKIAVKTLREEEALSLRFTQSLIKEKRDLEKALKNSTFATNEQAKALKRLDDIDAEIDLRTKATGRYGGFGALVKGGADLGGIVGMASKLVGWIGGAIALVVNLREQFDKIWDVGTKREKLDIVLSTSLNNNVKAVQEAKGIIKKFSADTGQDLEEVTMSFKRMTDIGIVPTYDTLTKLSDMATGSNKTVMDYAEAIADSQQAEHERLKEFGINAQKSGDKIIYTYRGISTEVENNALAISKYLIGLAETQGVAGSTAKVAETAASSWSKLKNTLNDWYEITFKKIAPLIKTINNALTDLIKPSLSAKDAFEAQKDKIKDLEKSLPSLIKQYEDLKKIAKPTQEQQQQLRDVIEKIGIVVPHARQGMDDYGNTLAINTGIAKEYIEQQKQMLKYTNRIAIEEAKGEVAALNKERDRLKREQTRLEKYGTDYQAIGKGQLTKVGGSQARITEIKARLAEIAEASQNAQTAIKAMNGEFLDTEKPKANGKKTAPTPTELEKIRLEKEVSLLKTRLTESERKELEKLAKKTKEEAEKRIEIEAKTLQEIDLMNAKAISDDLQREETSLWVEAKNAIENKEKELKEAKFSEEDQIRLLAGFRLSVNDSTETKIAELRDKAREKEEKKAEESAKRLLALTDKVFEEQQNALIRMAENRGDDLAVFNRRVALLEHHRDKELRNKEITEAEKLEIEKAYMLQYDALFDDLLQKQKVKTTANTKQRLQNDIDDNQRNIFELHDAKLAMMNFEYASELQNANKIGVSVTEIHRKYALQRKEIDREFWQSIAQIALSAYSTITDGLAQSRNLDNQAEQINLDNQKNRRIANLEKQYKAGSISEKKLNAEKERINEDYEKKQKVIKRKQAEAEHEANIIKATQSAIQSILQTMASVPFPFNIPLAAIQTALAFDQVSKLSAMPIPEFFSGGNTGNGDGFGIKNNDGKGGFGAWLHPNEYVVPEKITRQSWWKPVERVLESRRMNSYYNGGIASPSSSTMPSLPNNQPSDFEIRLLIALDKNNAVMESLNDRLEQGIIAKSLFTARDADEVNKLLTTNAQTKANALVNQ